MPWDSFRGDFFQEIPYDKKKLIGKFEVDKMHAFCIFKC